jgi:REP element-mobilizing transposase RayT
MSSQFDRQYAYERRLPHYQKHGVPVFITFSKLGRGKFSAAARDAILQDCLHDHGTKYELHVAVVMPEHVHLMLTPLPDEQGWPFSLPNILKALKGASARSVNKVMGTEGAVWQEESFDHVLRSSESARQKMEYIIQNPVRRNLACKPEQYPWLWIEEKWRPLLCSADTPVRGL